MCNEKKLDDYQSALEGVSYFRTLVQVELEGADHPVDCWFCLLKDYEDEKLWEMKLVVLDYDFKHGRGQEIIKRALTRLRLTSMYRFSVLNSMECGIYSESFRDINWKQFIEGHTCSCEFLVLFDEEEACVLIERLSNSDLPDKIYTIKLGSREDDERRELEKQIQRIKEQYEHEGTVVPQEEFKGFEKLQAVATRGRLGKLGDGPGCDCFWEHIDDKWILMVSAYDYDAGDGDGQELIEEILGACGLPGMQELSKMTTRGEYGEFTSIYREIISDSKVRPMEELSEDQEDELKENDASEVYDEDPYDELPACSFMTCVDEETFKDLFVRGMMKGSRQKHLGYAYEGYEPEPPKWDSPFELPF